VSNQKIVQTCNSVNSNSSTAHTLQQPTQLIKWNEKSILVNFKCQTLISVKMI